MRSSAYARGHKETSTEGKWDPGGYDMAAMRADTQAALEGDVALTEDEINKIAARVWAYAIRSSWTGENLSAAGMLAQADFYAIQSGYAGTTPPGGSYPGSATTAKVLLDNINEIPTDHGAGGGATPQEIADAVADEQAERMKE